ncbi:MAG: DUF6531 domain-containing protein, partial [Acidobacteriota bacterium]
MTRLKVATSRSPQSSGPGISYEIVVSAAAVDPFSRFYFLEQGEDICEPVIGVRVLTGLGFSSPEGDRLSAAGLGQPYIPPVVADFQEWLGDEGIYVPKDMDTVDSSMLAGGSVSPLTQVSPSEYRGFATVGETPGLEQVLIEGTFDGDREVAATLGIYALEPRILETVPPVLELSNDDRARTDLLIRYDVLPEDYRALTREILVMRGEEIVNVVPVTARQGPGEVAIGKGAFFDREQSYDLILVTHRGTDIEVRSERFPIRLDQQIIRTADTSISVSKEVDLPNGLQCEVPDLYEFSLNRTATVDLELRRVEGMNPDGTSELGAPFSLVANRTYGEGDHTVEVFTDDVPPGDYRLTLTARDGDQVENREGVALSQFTSRDSLPVGQSLIQGVNPWSGGLSLSRTDMAVPGRGAYLNFARTYSSNGGKAPNALGPGWSHSYESKVIVTPCGEAIVIGGEGSGMRFVNDGDGGLEPLRGYHGSLVANSEDNSFDFFTIAGTRYHYEFDGQREWLLHEISDPNGNTTTLEYGPGQAGLNLIAVTDSSGRQLAFRYAARNFPLYRGDVLVEVAGPDGLRIVFEYDDEGNLSRASRENGALVESYGYDEVPGLNHELRSILSLTTNELSGAETLYTYSSTDIGVDSTSYSGTLVIGVQQPEGGVTVFDYDETSLAQRATSATTTVTDRVGETMTLTFDQYGSPTSIEDA